MIGMFPLHSCKQTFVANNIFIDYIKYTRKSRLKI
jgi:hypothetical protein